MIENFIHSTHFKNQLAHSKSFTVLSDIHGVHRKLNLIPSDYLLLCGDFTIRGRQCNDFIEWIEQQQVNKVICVLGNHETKDKEKILEQMKGKTKEIHVLTGNSITLDHFQFVGSGYKFNVDNHLLNKIDSKKPLICLSHEPPFMMMDYGIRARQLLSGEFFHAGSKTVQKFVETIQPDLHCFGHCHSSHGICRKGKTLFVNGSIVDDNNELCFNPIQLLYSNNKFIPLSNSKCISLKQFLGQINEKPLNYLSKTREYKSAVNKLLQNSIKD